MAGSRRLLLSYSSIDLLSRVCFHFNFFLFLFLLELVQIGFISLFCDLYYSLFFYGLHRFRFTALHFTTPLLQIRSVSSLTAFSFISFPDGSTALHCSLIDSDLLLLFYFKYCLLFLSDLLL